MKVVHLSDIHINAHPILDGNPVERFRACMDHVSRHHSDAEIVLISGDLTHHGLPAAYEKLSDLLGEWDIRPELIIGNHDERAVFKTAFSDHPTDENGFVQFTRRSSQGRFIFLDTCKEGSHAGEMCSQRLSWLRGELESSREKQEAAFLVMHHNPVDVFVPDADRIGMKQPEEFHETLREFNDVIRHIFFGHCHYTLSGNAFGISMSAPQSTNHPCVPDFSGKPLMGYGGVAPNYGLAFVDEKSIVVHTIEFLNEDDVIWEETDESGWIVEDKH